MSQKPAIPGAGFAQEAIGGHPGGESGPGAIPPACEAAPSAGGDQVEGRQA